MPFFIFTSELSGIVNLTFLVDLSIQENNKDNSHQKDFLNYFVARKFSNKLLNLNKKIIYIKRFTYNVICTCIDCHT